MKDSVAVLIPTRNRLNLLKKSLASVLCQDVLPDEIIIVNDGSTDETGQFLSNIYVKGGLIVVLNREKSGGVNTARNQAIEITKSEWVMFLDDDDELLPNAVSLAKEKIKQLDNNYYLFYFNTLTRNDAGEFVGGFQFRQGQVFFDPNYRDVLTKYGLKNDCKPVFRRSIFNNNEYKFPEEVNGFESLVIRKMVRDGKKIRYYNEISTIMNLHTSFVHLSFSASVKNPEVFLRLHIQDIKDHYTFYARDRVNLKKKYLEIIKLSIRAMDFRNLLIYTYKLIFNKI